MGRKRKADTQQEQALKTSPVKESHSDFSYKTMYLEAQNKLEVLLEQHYDVVRKLEFANGKIAAYESMKEALTAQREVIVVSALAKIEETANKSSQPGPTCIAPPPPPAATIPETFKRKYTKANRRVTFQEPEESGQER